jgi:lipopolysaccharide biosynthesis protein
MNRAIVLAHFDPDGIVDEYVVDALRRYRTVASTLVMVSASVTQAPASIDGLVDHFIARENVGYDFCSWRTGIDALGSLDGIDELICVNDSVYGPMRDLAPVLQDVRVAHADAWGMCLSVQGTAARGHAATPHIQSWFIAMRSAVLRSEAFRGFWRSVVPVESKADVIERYELGLSQRLLDGGFRLAGIHDVRTALPLSWTELAPMLSLSSPLRSLTMLRRAYRGSHRTNPAELRPIRLLLDGVPYLKASIFLKNPHRVDPQHVDRTAQSLAGFDSPMAHRHRLRLQARNVAHIGDND